MITRAHCFTIAAPGRLAVLKSDVTVTRSIDPTLPPDAQLPAFGGSAIWDTGASGTVITQRVVDACNLRPIGVIKTFTANGERLSEVYLVRLALPNRLNVNPLRVTHGELGPDTDVLIGMDIISHGDFAVTNHGGQTTFSFRYPSMQRIDFLSSEKQKIQRNDLCPCGSKKKFKNCCSG